MLTPRLAAILLGFIALETSICALLIGDSSQGMRSTETAAFSALFSMAHGNEDFLFDANLSGTRVQFARPIADGKPLPYLRVEVDNERKAMDEDGNLNDDYLFEKYPLAPLDWAVILNNAREAGYRDLAIAQRLEFPRNTSSTELLALDTGIKDFERSVLVVDLNRGPDRGGRPPEVPTYLARHAIPINQVIGKAKLIEEVNEVDFPPSASGGAATIFAFRRISSSDEPIHRHAFARWGDLLIPSFPVAVAMLRHDAGPRDIRVVMGSYIQVGKGPRIPIDDNGRMLVEAKGSAEDLSQATIAETLLEVADVPQVGDGAAPGVVLVTNATKGKASPWGRPQELQNLVNTIDGLPQPGAAVAHPRLPPWGETIFYGAFAFVIALFLRLRPLARLGAFAGALVVSLIILFALLKSTSTWIPVLPLVITSLVGFGLSFGLRRHAVPAGPKKPKKRKTPKIPKELRRDDPPAEPEPAAS